MKESPRFPGSTPARVGAVVVLALLFALATALIDGHPGVAPMTAFHAPFMVLANALPGILLALLLLALTRRALLSFVLALLVEGLIYGVNALKVANLGTPLMPADFRMVGQLEGGGGELLAGYLPHSPWPYLAILAVIAIIIALAKLEPPLFARRARAARWSLAGVSAVLLVTLLAAMPAWKLVYNGPRMGMQPWSASATTKTTGLISSLMLFHLQYGNEHDKPDTKAAMALMSQYDQAIRQRLQAMPTASEQAKPDIIVILSESFFDPTILKGYPDGTDLAPNLHRLARTGTSGWLHVPTFGGGTIRTEFEVLTGLPLRYFRDIRFPYLQIHAKVIPGMVRLLKAQGYETLAVHGNDPQFWNRASAFKALGFDRFVSRSQFPADDSITDGKYMSDKSFTDELLRQLPDSGPPKFVLGISIEAHGPYDIPPANLTERDQMPVPAGVTGNDKTQLQNYIYHTRHADQQLGRLIDTLKGRKRRAIVLFFGDHLPALVPAFQKAGFKNGQGFLTQTVPYLLYDTGNPTPVDRNAAAWELPGMVLAHTDIHDPWFALTQVVAPQLAALTRAPDAPQASEDEQQKSLDKGMAAAAMLRLKGKLDAVWTKVDVDAGPATNEAAQTAQQPTNNDKSSRAMPSQHARL
ncbi:LTA synthase family protein [Oleiagrimonas sp. C23AA]|uniref:LTA synthase family protein n=1 Tax=Oleiagrimonas sp. C23AA TaxID=2719047 RepID=UPI001420687C|nr:LTA synthase family protein [Oleiagrimonas sp. C23AA]NII12301.1 LTA synthase family protein [Oleiagrimonas sp. C23AA]